MTAGMSKWVSGLRVGGVPARDILASCNEDEALGAVVGDYRDWDYIVHICTYAGRPPRKVPLSRNKLIRWLIKHDHWPVNWCWQVNGPNGQTCASSSLTRKQGVEETKACIDRYIRNGCF